MSIVEEKWIVITDKKNSIPSHVWGITSTIQEDLIQDLTILPSNKEIQKMTMDNLFHSPAQKEVHNHLSNNIGKVFLDQLKNKDVYTQYNICVDGREDGEGIASFGWFAGILGATLPALKEIFWDKIDAHSIIKTRLWDTKFYVHCDDHIQHETHGANYCDCKKIGCGAINLMLKTDNAEQYWYNNIDRDFFWKLIDSHGKVKILAWDHEEQGIIIIDNEIEKDQDGKDYIHHTKGNIKDWTQYFISHTTWRNLIIDYFSEDLGNNIIQQYGFDKVNGFDEQTLIYALKAAIMKWSDIHANATLWLLWAAQKVLKEKGDNAIITTTKICPEGNHVFA